MLLLFTLSQIENFSRQRNQKEMSFCVAYLEATGNAGSREPLFEYRAAGKDPLSAAPVFLVCCCSTPLNSYMNVLPYKS